MYKSNYWGEEYEECSARTKELLNNVDNLCHEKRLRWYYMPQARIFMILTGISSWRIDMSKKKIRIYHDNFTMRNYHVPDPMTYHLQNVNVKNIIHAINYVARHDKYKYRPECNKTSIDLAFDRIKKQRVACEG